MKIIWNGLAVGLGGAVGSISRYLLSLIPIKTPSGFPFITLGINLVGAFLIGIIVAAAGKNNTINPTVLLLLKVGFCGGFTTFSSFSLETAQLLRNGNVLTAVWYMVLSVILCLGAVLGAQALVK